MRQHTVRILACIGFTITLLATPVTAGADGPWVLDSERPIYTWRDAQSTSSTVYSETSGAGFFDRRGVSAFIPKASGYTWQTTVWLGSVSTSGSAEARLMDSRLNHTKTKARFIYRPAPNRAEKTRFIAWITKVQSSARLAETSSSSSAVDPAEPSLTTDDEHIRELVPDVIASSALGSESGYEAWKLERADGSIGLVVSDGRYFAATGGTPDQFKSSGLSLRFDTGARSAEFVLLPGEDYITGSLVKEGFTEVSPGLLAATASATELSLGSSKNQVSPGDIRVLSASGGTDVVVPLYGPAEP